MADSDLQAALNQSKIFDLNQVTSLEISDAFSPFSLTLSLVHMYQKQMISMQFLDDFKRAILVLFSATLRFAAEHCYCLIFSI
jgi:hypothetical protein